MAQAIEISQAARLLGITERAVRKRCDSGELPGAKKDGGVWRVPITADARLSGVRVVGTKTDTESLAAIPNGKRDDALRKVGVITAFEKYSGACVRGGGLRSEALVAFSAREKIPVSTLKRWLRSYRERGLVGLVDARGGGGGDVISEEAWEQFKALYLDPRQPTVRQCLRIVNYINKAERKGWLIPSYSALCRFIDKNLPMPVQILWREGQSAFDSKCAPFVQTDLSNIDPGSYWVGDHHQLNCFVRHRNAWIRPWLTAWEDLRSRAIVGWVLCSLPNQSTILQSFKVGAEKHGPPESVKVDNGKDYSSRLFTGATKRQRRALKKGYLDVSLVRGLYSMLGIDVSFAIPYHPQSKNIERFFDTLDQQFCKMLPTYTGKDSGRRPDSLTDFLNTTKAIEGAYNLQTLEPLLADFMDAYNRTQHSALGGKSPLEVLSTRRVKRACAPGVLPLLLRVWSNTLVVGKNGVLVNGLYYGQYSTDLLMRQGELVRCSYDPADVSRVYVYEADSLKLICIADQAQLIAYGATVSDSQLRDAMREKARAARACRSQKNARLVKDIDLVHLALAAKISESRPAPKVIEAPVIQPVATPLDDQIVLTERLEQKIAAYEQKREKIIFDWDFDEPDEPKLPDLKLDWDDDPKSWVEFIDKPVKQQKKKKA